MRFLLRIVINAIALWVTAQLISGIAVTSDLWGLLLVALVFGLVNAFIKPIVQILSLPLTILTLGLFTLVINALMLLLAAWLIPGLTIEGGGGQQFLTALLGSIVISIVSMLLGTLLGDRD